MRRLVRWMIGETLADAKEDDGSISIDRGGLASLCLWQLVIGYKLREAEATGKAREIMGR